MTRPNLITIAQRNDGANRGTALMGSGAVTTSAVDVSQWGARGFAVVVGSAISMGNKVLNFQVSPDTTAWYTLYGNNGVPAAVSATANDPGSGLYMLPADSMAMGSFAYVRGALAGPGLGINENTWLVFVGLN